ncbi:polysaccharide pyruvyl transferase family protein [Salinimicrobium sp. MT39]|uniref:Polysaccharide pyruvyl transferase family protein n=1 Tax=Salinimicrobium profundisediminis TaxID=2994553 RepID=A0A9X3I108_9FLAO|nr:polysaccharide pyruvyl transferase family protein [Salinimicrobium profundisediminis]MCX2837472.1 polysaccharide pyruvyl transferase family protein [Salinimicrobium profundisediminis]
MKKPFNFKNLKKIPLFYWSERRFIFREKENYGDLLSKYLVEKISGKETNFVHPKKQAWYKTKKANLLAIGSIIHHASRDSVVWGSGIIDHEQELQKADFRAVRGPRTREYLLKLGYECPEVYGDPAILLPDYYNPQVKKIFKLGIVPHYHDYSNALEVFAGMQEVKVIELLTMDVEATTREILGCDRILSTSLHGLIVAHAYGIPAVWVKMSNKIFGNEIKYADYLESVELETYEAEFIENEISEEKISDLFKKYPNLISEAKLNKLKTGLLEVKPF